MINSRDIPEWTDEAVKSSRKDAKIINTTTISPSVKTITVKFDYTKKPNEEIKMINSRDGSYRWPSGGGNRKPYGGTLEGGWFPAKVKTGT